MDIPDLRVVSTGSLLLHEYADSKRVARLADRLREDGYLKNPPIVASIPGTERYVVLDGANRTSAVMRNGCPHLLVQVVDYDSEHVQLRTWYHLITGREPETFLKEISELEGLTLVPSSLKHGREALAQRSILAYLVLPGANPKTPTVYVVDGMPGTEHHGTETSTALLNAMVDTYKSDPQVAIHRSSTDQLDDLMVYYDNVSGLVVFPAYTPDDIIKLALAGTYVPTGITRHIINRRALRVNIPMSFLNSNSPLEEKNAWWHDQVKAKLASNEIRFYQESTYLFDE